MASYPLGAGPTCGDTEFANTANPYDEDPPTGPLHSVIQVLEVPLNNPAATTEIASPRLSYPGDPDGRMEWCEKGLCAGVEPAAVACHDIAVHMEHNMAGAACAEQGQVWEIDPSTGIPDTEDPMMIGDDEVSSGGTGDIPGAVDFFHSVMFDNGGEVVNWVDESFGTGCPTMTNYNPRPWNPAGGRHKTGKMFFSDLESGEFLSEFHVGDLRPSTAAGEYCSAHMGMTTLDSQRDLLVNAWYTGGVDVIDFTKPTRLKEIAYYDRVAPGGTWSAYPYTGPLFKTGPGIPVYATDGVTTNALAEGMVAYRAILPKPGRKQVIDHLNPQTMDFDVSSGHGGKPRGHGGKPGGTAGSPGGTAESPGGTTGSPGGATGSPGGTAGGKPDLGRGRRGDPAPPPSRRSRSPAKPKRAAMRPPPLRTSPRGSGRARVGGHQHPKWQVEQRREYQHADDRRHAGDEQVDAVATGEAGGHAGDEPALARARETVLGEPRAGAVERVLVGGVVCGHAAGSGSRARGPAPSS